MKISIINDDFFNFGDLSWAELAKLGELEVHRGRTTDLPELIRRVGDAEIVVSDLYNYEKAENSK